MAFKKIERIEQNLEPLPKDVCIECQRKMSIINGKYKCVKCGITIEQNRISPESEDKYCGIK